MYLNIHALMIVMVTLPVTSYECEQSISMLRFIKLLSLLAKGFTNLGSHGG